MIKKQIQKLFKTLLIFPILATILLGNFVISPTAKADAITENCDITWSNLNAMASSYQIIGHVISDKDVVNVDEPFNLYMNVELPESIGKVCATANNQYRFELYSYLSGSNGGAINTRTTAPGITGSFYKNDETKEYRFEALSQPLTLAKNFGITKDFVQARLNAGTSVTFDLKGYFYKSNVSTYQFTNSNYIEIARITADLSTGSKPPVRELPQIKATGFTDLETPIDYTKVQIKITGDQSKKGLRAKYRVRWDDVDLAFGSSAVVGLDNVHVEWADQSNKITFKQKFTLPAKDNPWGYTLDPRYVATSVFFNYAEDAKKIKVPACKGTYTGTDCTGVVFRETDSSKYGAGAKNASDVLPFDFNPILKAKSWQDKVPTPSPVQKTSGNGGKELGHVEYVALPAIFGYTNSFTFSTFDAVRAIIGTFADVNSVTLIAGVGNIKSFTVEVYATDDDIKAACKADPSVAEADKSKCDTDLGFAKYGFAETITQTTSSGETKAATPAQSLYGFITRVISDIIILLQSWIYRIFAFIVVPILNALLRVRPYEDAFVNVIYPGWLILRNLANIFFIVSLLVVGLRILFQLSASGTAVGFIRRLLIMALLVNFSLVISQGIIGIADTVQSQFLPANTKIIESLGQKLMVEPLKSMRDEVALKDGGVFNSENSEAALSDTVKPIVLLVLSIAAFFSFVAIAAFLMIRLVVLWVLYMISPIAYVGFVMEETKKYASQWWSEFIKQAMLAPILVFFLNIAALMATTFSTAGKNNLFDKFNPDGSLSGDVVIGSLTILTHFIVIGFLFAGMKFALSFGGIGSKAIVDYAKKGFDNVTKRPAKWAGGVAKDAAKTQWERNFKGGMLDPLAYRDAFKKKVADTTKDKYATRMLNKADKFSPAGLFEDPKKTLKYLMYKAVGAGSQANAREAEKLIDKSEILTADERKSLDDKHTGESARLAPLEEALSKLNANTPLSVAEGQDLLTHLSTEKMRLRTEGAGLVAGLQAEAIALRASGNVDAADAKDNQALGVQAEYMKKRKDLQKTRDELLPVVNAAVAAGAANLSLDDQLKEDITDRLDNDIKDLVKEIKTLAERKSVDDKRLAEHGGGPMTLENRRKLLKQANELNEIAAKRSAPQSSVAKQIRREREDEEKKKVEDTDDADELIAQYKKAMATNNLPLASAIAKKMATEGSFSDLLKEYGYRNNMQSLQEFVGESFKKYAPNVRLQIMSEIGSLNEKNGNRGASRATKIDMETGQMRLATPQEHKVKHNSALAKKPMSEAKKMKKNEFGEEGADGRLKLYSGAAKMLSQFKSIKKPAPLPAGAGAVATRKYDQQVATYERNIREYQRDMAPTAKAILDATNSNLIDGEAIKVLKDIAKV